MASLRKRKRRLSLEVIEWYMSCAEVCRIDPAKVILWLKADRKANRKETHGINTKTISGT